MKKFLFILSIVSFFCFEINSQALYSPVTTTNYNVDGVAETNPSSLTTSQALDGSNYIMLSLAYGILNSMTVGLPNNGLVSASNRTYQMQPYNQNNVLYVPTGLVDSLIIVTPAPYNAVSIMGYATEGTGAMNVTLRFTDNTIQTFNNITLADWFTGTGNVLNSFGRANRTTGVISNPASAPNLYPIDFNLTCVNRVKNLKTIKFANTGTNPRLIIMAVAGATNSAVISTTVNPVTCSGGSNGSAVVTTTGGTPPFTYSWSSVPLQFGGSLNNVPTGVYSYTMADGGGCTQINTVSITQSLSTQPSLFVSSNGTAVCLGNTLAIAASGANTYTWNNGSNTQIQIVTPTANAVYTVSGLTSVNCLLTGSIAIVVNPVPTVNISGVNPQLCINSSSFVINTSPSGGTLTGNNFVGGVFSPSTAGIGTYTFTYSYLANGCGATTSATTTINGLPSVSISLTNSVFCNTSNNFSLTGSGLPSGGTYTGMGVNGNLFTPSVGAGNYIITYNYSDVNSCSSSATAAVSVSSLAAPSITIPKNFFCTNSPNLFVSTSPSNGTYTGVGLTGTGLFNPSVAGIGNHVLSYSISSGPCSNFSSITVTVSTCSGLESNSLNNFEIYPNPNNGLFYLKNLNESSVILYNALGEKVFEKQLQSQEESLKIENLNFGIYYLSIERNNSKISKRIIVTANN